MKALLQRVTQASVTVDGERVAAIGTGLLVFVGVAPDDGAAEVDWLARKLLGIRVFPDAGAAAGKLMNRSITDMDGELLVVSQFTLAADLGRGMRPGFGTAAPPEAARYWFDALLATLRARWHRVQCGRFGADMQVAIVNDGPVTFLLERRSQVSR